MKGARVLSVQGRKTGEWHSTPVNALSTAGQRYLVAPRGETQWVRNIRVSREARLTLGRRTETVHVVEFRTERRHPSSAHISMADGRPSSALPCSACSGGGRVGRP